MKRVRNLIAIFVALAFLAGLPARAAFDQRAETSMSGETAVAVHPTALDQGLLVAVDSPEKAFLCVVYGNTTSGKNRNKGNILADFEIARVDADSEEPVIEELRLRGQIKRGTYLECAEIDQVRSGDIIYVEYQFKSMPRLRETKSGDPGSMRIIMMLAESEPTLADFLPPDLTALCSGSDGEQSTALSAENQRAIWRIRAWPTPGRGIQLRFHADGRKYIDVRYPDLTVVEYGPSDTIAGAANIACPAIGCGPGQLLKPENAAAVARLRANIRGSVTRLGLRFETNGVFIDWQGPPEGIHTGPFSSIAAAVNNFCARIGGCT